MNDFLVFSDLHLHNWRYAASVNEYGYNTRLLDQASVLRQIGEYARDHEIRSIFFCGDLFHTHQTLHAGPLNIAVQAFQDWQLWDISVVLLPGNHDIADREGRITTLAGLRGSNVHTSLHSQAVVSTLQSRKFRFLPYTQDESAIRQWLDQTTEGDFLFMHAGVKGASLNSKGFILNDEVLDPSWIPDHVAHAFIGHYHSHCSTPKWTIPGSPMQLNWSDSGEDRGFLHVTMEPFQVMPVALEFPKFVVLDATQELFPEQFAGNFVKLVGVDPDPSFAQRLKDAGARSVEFEVLPSQAAAPNLPGSMGLNIDNVVQKFVASRELDSNLVRIGNQLMDGTHAHIGS